MIFNRPNETARVLEAISIARPTVLLVIADGPRLQVAGEPERVAECREILSRIDWPCRVLTNFSETNLGCRNRVSSGLDWVFSEVDEAIILEDDCLPTQDFFRFTSELLEKYRADERVGSISGSSTNFGYKASSESYFFSNFPAIWGWATWSRVWRKYNVGIPSWPESRDIGLLNKVLGTRRATSYWKNALDDVHAKKIDTWDYQLAFLHWTEGYFSIVPSKNLVSNIGFGPNATHTLNASSVYANATTEKLSFPLNHPVKVSHDAQLDRQIELSKFAKSRTLVTLTKVFNSLPGSVKSLIQKGYGKVGKLL
jgi:hypothetical protein